MFKYKKITLIICTFLYFIFSLIELVKYLFIDSNLFGLIYLINNLIILFLLIPTTHNYKKNFSKIRISKFILIVLFGLFNSFILQNIFLNYYEIIDSSKKYIESIFIIKNIFKLIIYIIIIIITVLEFNLKKLLKGIGK